MTTLEHNIGLSTELLRHIVDVIVKHANPRRIILYGSRVRGDHQPTSDIDVAVVCREGSSLFRTLIDDEVRTLLKLDIIDLDDADDHLRQQISREGLVVYDSV